MAQDIHTSDAHQSKARRDRHMARVDASSGKATSLRVRIAIGTRGLLALAGMISSTLLATAVIVGVATRKLPECATPRGMERYR